jgi:V8-like Glu-specific endopeptidase
MNKTIIAPLCLLVLSIQLCFGEDAALFRSGRLRPSSFIWTKGEMASARGYPLMRNDRFFHSSVPKESPEDFAGDSGIGEAMPSQSTSSSPPIAEGYAYPFPFTRYQNFTNYDSWPYSAIVKIYFRENGRNFVCSGAVWPNGTIITAGHCVFNPETGQFHADFRIVPREQNHLQPLGSFEAAEAIVPNEWRNSGAAGFDIALILTESRGGKYISDFTGSLGGAWNVRRKQAWTLIGYPVDPPFDGNSQQICHSSYADGDTRYQPQGIGIGCDLSGGISGGPLIVNFSGKKGMKSNLVNGVASYRPTTQPKALYFSYFGNAARKLWENAKSASP